jgi:hypothetical protein
MTALASITLQSASASVSFSNIPQNYRDLVFSFNGTGNSSLQVSVEFNNDTAENYSRIYIEARGSTGAGPGTDKRWMADVGTSQSNFIFQIIDYSATDKHKTGLVRANDASAIVWALAGRWSNTAAINSVRLFSTTSAFAAGSTFNLYGRIA